MISNTKRAVTSLIPGEQVVFKLYSSIYGKKIPETGTVDFVDTKQNYIWISYLCGYKNMDAFIPFEDMLAVYNPNGEYMEFGNIRGYSDELISD